MGSGVRISLAAPLNLLKNNDYFADMMGNALFATGSNKGKRPL
jgi:hypothetical protein